MPFAKLLQKHKQNPMISHQGISHQVIQEAIERVAGAPGWAVHLPEDPATFHTGTSDKARQFQAVIANTGACAGWAESHMCLMETMHRFRFDLPRTYLEIGVMEGWSVLSVISSLRQQRALYAPDEVLAPLFDELVLADMWAGQFGGSGRGSNRHIQNLLRAANVELEHVTFLDGDSKKTVPAYFKRRKNRAPFDAIYIDGDHSYHGAKADLENVLPHVGKVLFFDDIYHPVHCLGDRLLELHMEMVERLKQDFYVFLKRRGYGFAAYIRQDVFEALG